MNEDLSTTGRPPPAGATGTDRFATAVVLAAGMETRYARAGTGAPVVLLRGGPLQSACAGLLAAMGRRLRVIEPEIPALASDAFATWLRAFLDGLGLARVSLVAGDGFALGALEFSSLEPDRVDRVVLLHDDCGNTKPLDDRRADGGQPLLVLGDPEPGPGAAGGGGAGRLDVLLRFLCYDPVAGAAHDGSTPPVDKGRR